MLLSPQHSGHMCSSCVSLQIPSPPTSQKRDEHQRKLLELPSNNIETDQLPPHLRLSSQLLPPPPPPPTHILSPEGSTSSVILPIFCFFPSPIFSSFLYHFLVSVSMHDLYMYLYMIPTDLTDLKIT